MATKNLSYLMKHSLRLNGTTCETHPNRIIWEKDYVDSFSLDDYMAHPHTYCVKNQTVVFVDCSRNVYVTPYTRKTINILIGNGFVKSYYYVPFTGNDFPTDYEFFWRNLRMQAVLQRDEEFYEDCKRYSSLNGIGELNEEELLNCIEVPYEGILVEREFFFLKVYPMTLDLEGCSKFIGYFDWFKGIWVFVHFNGKTYVTMNHDVISKLEKIGYKKGNLFNKLRKNEKSCREIFQSRWGILSKI